MTKPIRRIYVASSWRNEHQPAVVARLRAEGFEVYDFRTAAAFSWAVIEEGWRDWTVTEWLYALMHPASIAGFNSDMGGVEWCDACVMVQPCGQSAGLEAGYVKGSGRPLIVYAPAIREAELMVKMANLVTDDLDAVVSELKTLTGPEYFAGLRDRIKERYGRTCAKAPHSGGGYLHDENDDGPYDIDGVSYCGRCHHFIDAIGACSAPALVAS